MERQNAATIFAALMLFSGCVSTGAYRKAQDDTKACLRDNQTLAQQIDTLNQEKSRLNQENADLAQAAAAKSAELAQMKGTYDQLVGNLKNEISSGQIQVTELQGKLTLKM